MRIELKILNPESDSSHIADPLRATWHSRTKSYETDFYGFDEDVMNSTLGHNLDRITLNDVQLTSKSQIEELENFLKNAKNSFKH